MELDFTKLNQISNYTFTNDVKTEKQTQQEQVYQAYQKNIKKSELLQTEIINGVRQGERPEILFLKAVKVISLMTGNSLYYDQIKNDMISIYGDGLLNTVPLQLQIDEAKKRVDKMTESLKREGISDSSKKSIELAINEHEKMISQLESLKQSQ